MRRTSPVLITSLTVFGLLAACGGTASVAQTSSAAPAPASVAAPATKPSVSAAVPASSLARPASASPRSSIGGSPAASGSKLQATPANQGSGSPGAVAAAVSQQLANAEASLPARKFACAQLPNVAQPAGQVLISVAQIEKAVGFQISQVFWNANVGGMVDCRYDFSTPAGGARLEFGIDENTAHAKDDFSANQANARSLFPGYTVSAITPVPSLGDSAFKATLDGRPTDLHVLKGSTYFEIDSDDLKEERLLNMAHAIVDGQAS